MFESDVGDSNRAYIAKEYGSLDKPDAVVPVQVGERAFDFRVWLDRKHPRVMVEASKEVAAAAAGYKSKLSFGVLKERLAEGPYQAAALQYLASTGRVGCKLERGSPITPTGYEWSYRDCSERSS